MFYPKGRITHQIWLRLRSFRYLKLLTILGFLVIIQRLPAGEFDVSSAFSTTETTLGREVTYSITIRKNDESGDLVMESPTQIDLPRTTGLTFGRFQTSEKYQSTLGDDPIAVIVEYEVTTNAEGRIVMPSFPLNYMGQRLMVPASSIKVRSQQEDLSGGEVDWFYVELVDTPDTLWLGERFKTSLNLYVFDGLRSVTFTKPNPIGSDFSLDSIVPGPTERLITKGLYRYKVYSWPLTITAVRSGKISVGFKVNLNYRIPNDRLAFIRAARAENDSAIESLLQDSLEESQTLFSENLNISVSQISEPGTLDSYYNAIGSFKVISDVDSATLYVGQPTNLTLRVRGEGNFGAFRVPKMKLDGRWRVFEPEESFDDEDRLSYKGTQTYRYVIIPLSADIRQIPTIEYEYFDTQTDEFNVLESTPIEVNVAGDTIVESVDLVQVKSPETETDDAVTTLTSLLIWDEGQNRKLSCLFFKNMSFYWIQGGVLLLFCLFLAYQLRRQKIDEDQQFARKLEIKSWTKKYVNLARKAARDEDSEQFYESTFLAFCAIVASLNESNVEAITVEDVLNWVEQLDMNDSMKAVIHGYLRRYEEQRFSRISSENPPLKYEFSRLQSILGKFHKLLGSYSES